MSMDPLFKVEVLSHTPNPQQVIYAAMHQDYAEGFGVCERTSTLKRGSMDIDLCEGN